MVKYCYVPQCESKYSKNCELHFHDFPKNKKECKKWLVLLRIKNKPNQVISAYVCSAHFLPDDHKTYTGGITRLKKGSVPSKNIPTRSFENTTKNKFISQTRYTTICSKRLNTELPSEDQTNPEILQQDGAVNEISDCYTKNVGTQAEIPQSSLGCQTILKSSHLSSCLFQTLSDNNIKYLTGFDSRRFNLLFSVLKNDLMHNEFEIHLELPDQLILCLFKLRHNLDYMLIGFMYHISRLTVSKIFQYVIKVLYKYLKAIDFWANKYNKENSYTAIIDCTEIKTEKSQNPQTNQDLFSHYKNTYTLKYLVAIDEKGLVIFCSNIFGGSTSDRAAVVNSGFLNKLKANDIILADRGFDISDILEKQKVVLNIPPFLRGKKQLAESEVMETRIVANRRIHIERVIGLTKKFEILNGTFPAHLWPLADYIIYSVNMLCNFKSSIVN